MKNGDISNSVGTTIAFQCMGTLLHYQDDGITNKVLNALFGKTKRAVVNERVRAVMEYIYRSTDMTVDIVVFEDDYSKDLETYLVDNFMFSRILIAPRPSYIGSRLRTGDITYYVDDDVETRSMTNNRYAIPFDKLSSVVKISGKRR